MLDSIRHHTAHGVSVPLLLITDVVLRACLHTRFLHTFDRLFHRDANQVRVCTKAFPVASTSWNLAQRPCDRTKLHMNTELLCFRAEKAATLTDQVNIPCGGGVDASSESGRAIDVTDSQGAI